MSEEQIQSDPRNPGDCSSQSRTLLALTMVPGLGPVRIAQLISSIGSPEAVLKASASQIASVRGIGSGTASNIAQHLHRAIDRVELELEKIADAGAHVVSIADPHYPAMLGVTPSAPPILMIRGQFEHESTDQYPVAIVGSRACSVYGSEQAGKFGSALGRAGLTIVSGGARGIDTAAHRGAISAGGRTAVVLGCGISKVYPPENKDLFDEIVESGGAIVSELPVDAMPDAKNFPARNRIISGLSLGVVVIEAGLKSGALITARHALEDHGREVMGIPGRIDSPASLGTNQILKDGAHLVTDPGDVISILERDAFHLFSGTHQARTTDPGVKPHIGLETQQSSLQLEPIGDVDSETRQILDSLNDPRTGDELADLIGIDPGQIRAKLTVLEIQGRVRRVGSRFVRVR
ncbi:MAG: DNA-processing protein DprA [Phycisphaerales bacterium]|nr:DNA-processing protein DprA [Phycisphaerales bacterium]